ncbi:1-acyl-sn-glycerol-3-phosphate acyltransferase [Thalictrum thalictroides]|uniref:1-acyl-sn-glycerol-3-phosphate acyltransferase n=1 Tax=Thalictrum thalictroides TaxID=46969 RepID=A0A7J6X1C7_THATH|nr:1-acyl-sn-glycerol-3-phosphate acyltransferase [Thalictrum thalictroides]
MIQCMLSLYKTSTSLLPSALLGSSPNIQKNPLRKCSNLKYCRSRRVIVNRRRAICCGLIPVDPWAPTIETQGIASQLFAASLFPYLGFLYFITKSKTAPKVTLFGFYFLLAFVGATIPAGIYAKVHYGTSLSNVDWLHGGAESLLTLTNLFIVMGLREALRKAKVANENKTEVDSETKQDNKSSV